MTAEDRDEAMARVADRQIPQLGELLRRRERERDAASAEARRLRSVLAPALAATEFAGDFAVRALAAGRLTPEEAEPLLRRRGAVRAAVLRAAGWRQEDRGDFGYLWDHTDLLGPGSPSLVTMDQAWEMQMRAEAAQSGGRDA